MARTAGASSARPHPSVSDAFVNLVPVQSRNSAADSTEDNAVCVKDGRSQSHYLMASEHRS